MNFQRHRIQPGGRNHVTGEGVAHELAVQRALRVGVVHVVLDDGSAERINTQVAIAHGSGDGAEIARAERGGRNRVETGGVDRSVGAGFVVKEEERLVVTVIDLGNSHGSADGEAVVVAARTGVV